MINQLTCCDAGNCCGSGCGHHCGYFGYYYDYYCGDDYNSTVQNLYSDYGSYKVKDF